MAIVMDISLPVGTFLFESVFEQLPEVRVEIERVVPIRYEMLPFVWVFGEGREEFATVVEELMPLAHLELLFDDRDALFYRLYWTHDAKTFFDAVEMEGLVITRAAGTVDGWNLTMQFDDQTSVKEFRAQCERRDIDFTLHRLTNLVEWQADKYSLTTRQRNALVRAYEAGYYQEPRRVSTEGLAAEFGVSARAMSGRLRRGTERLIESALVGK
jgi:hypothetical protein